MFDAGERENYSINLNKISNRHFNLAIIDVAHFFLKISVIAYKKLFCNVFDQIQAVVALKLSLQNLS